MIIRSFNHEAVDKTIRRNFITGIIATFLVFIGAYIYCWINPPSIDLNNPAQNRAGYRTGQRVKIDAKIIGGEECLAALDRGENYTIYVIPELTTSQDNGLDYLSGFVGIKTDADCEGAFNQYMGIPEEQRGTLLVHVDGYLKEIDTPHGIIAAHTFEDRTEIYFPLEVTSDPKDSTVAYIFLTLGIALGLYSAVSLFFALRIADKAKES